MTAQDRLIVALDVPTRAQALDLVGRLDGGVQWFKVGLELYLAEGHSIVEELRSRGYSVFLDLKLHDIPNTVAAAVRSAASTGANLLTLHASGGPEMLTAAKDAVSNIAGGPRLLAVTVLTSMNAAQLAATGVAGAPADQVLRLAEMAVNAGVDGLVCSPLETSLLRSSSAAEALLVVPGIRPMDAATNDQSRIATPADAVRNGADMLVIGRPITLAKNPAEAARDILDQIVSVA